MSIDTSSRWLRYLERKIPGLAIPNIAILWVTLQALGFLMVMQDPIWIDRLALIPSRVLQGELWRLITFLSLPVSTSPIWVIFSLWFVYSILNTIENLWGSFKTTFYVLMSAVLTLVVSFALDFPVTQMTDFQSTLFLAAATLFPDFEILVYFVLPVKMKWLGWISVAFVFIHFLSTSFDERIYLLAVYSNYLVFFGPVGYQRLKQAIRRYQYKQKLK